VRKKQKNCTTEGYFLYFFYNTNLTYLKSVKSQTGSQWTKGQKDRKKERKREREGLKERRIKSSQKS